MGTKRVGWARIKSLINENANQLKMLHPQIIAVSGTRTLTAGESGATIAWTMGSAHHITLPTAAVGMRYDFVIETGADANHTIITASADKIHGRAYLLEAGTVTQCNAQSIEDGGGVDKVHWKGDATTHGASAGDTCTLICVEATKWVATVNQTTSGTIGATLSVLAN
jgi:hypothetical protein